MNVHPILKYIRMYTTLYTPECVKRVSLSVRSSRLGGGQPPTWRESFNYKIHHPQSSHPPTDAQVDRLLASGPHRLDGKTLDCKRALPHGLAQIPYFNESEKKIFVGGLPNDCFDEELRLVKN
jgi:hypothetical protein